MATNSELQARLTALETMLARLGIRLPAEAAQKPEERADYIAFGSPEHAAFLGIEEANGEEGDITYKSRTSDKTYRLVDEVTPFMHFSDPQQVAGLVLRQKVGCFEAGPPPIPTNAPAMWEPADMPL